MFASVNSQNTRVNIHVNNANTQIVLNEIEKQTDYLFVYDTKEIDLNRKVSVEAQNRSRCVIICLYPNRHLICDGG